MNHQKIIQEIADEIEGNIYLDYSGRGMFGKTCLGISTDCQPAKVIELAAERGIKGASWDSLGMGYIIYWPSIQKTA